MPKQIKSYGVTTVGKSVKQPLLWPLISTFAAKAVNLFMKY